MSVATRHFVFLLAIVLAPAAGASPQSRDVATVVSQFYPPSLDADLTAIGAGNTDVRHQCYAVLESDLDGSPAIVLAGYTNSRAAALRVLRTGPTGSSVVDETSGDLLIGSSCSAAAVDIDGDGTLEAFVKFGARPATRDWVYAWRDGALVDLSPLTADGMSLPVYNSDLVDLDGDGLLELRSRPPRSSGSPEPAAAVVIFSLRAGSYVLDPGRAP